MEWHRIYWTVCIASVVLMASCNEKANTVVTTQPFAEDQTVNMNVWEVLRCEEQKEAIYEPLYSFTQHLTKEIAIGDKYRSVICKLYSQIDSSDMRMERSRRFGHIVYYNNRNSEVLKTLAPCKVALVSGTNEYVVLFRTVKFSHIVDNEFCVLRVRNDRLLGYEFIQIPAGVAFHGDCEITKSRMLVELYGYDGSKITGEWDLGGI